MPPVRRGASADPPSSTSAATPTYASVVRLASATRQHPESGGISFASRAIGSDDVDRQDELDDLDPSYIPVPWRSLSRVVPFEPHPGDQLPATLPRERQPAEEADRNVADGIFAPFPPLVSLDELLEEGPGSNEGGDDGGGGVLTRSRPTNPESSDTEQEHNTRSTQLSGPLSDQLPPPSAESAAPLHRRIIRRSRGGVVPQRTRNYPLISSDTEEDGDDIEVDLDEDEPFEWTRIEPTEMRRSSGIYGQRNRTEEDLTVLGGSGGSMSLRRGMFNGPRRSVIDRLRELDSARPVRGFVPIPVPAPPTVRTGLPPTNAAAQDSAPITVSSDDAKRTKREGDTPEQPSSKRRRLDTPADEEIKPIISAPERPSYLSYTTCPFTAPLPSDFGKPHQGSSVSLSKHTSPSHPPRPCITFTFTNLPGGARDDEHASSLRADVPAPPECGVYYYEAEVLDSGKSGYMAVGWMKKENRLNKLVGWEKGSYGWHGDDGRSFAGISTGEPFAEGWTAGDVVGCGINFVTKRAFFTKNGKLMGHVFRDLGRNLYPAIGLRTPKESIVVNFTGPFVFDIDKYVKEIRDTAWKALLLDRTERSFSPAKGTRSLLDATIESVKASVVISADMEITAEPSLPYGSSGDATPPPAYQSVKERVPAAFVLDFLQHEGYGKTLSLVRKDLAKLGRIKLKESKEQLRAYDENAKMADFPSKEACLAWLKGRIVNSDALALPWSLIDEVVPDREKRILKVHHFMRVLRQALIDGTDEALAIEYIRTVSGESKFWSDEDKTFLADAIALLGSSPAEWDGGGVSGQTQREKDAERCIASARLHLGMKPLSYLSLAFGELSTGLKLMASEEPITAFFDPLRLISEPRSFHDVRSSAGNKAEGSDSVKVEEKSVQTSPAPEGVVE